MMANAKDPDRKVNHHVDPPENVLDGVDLKQEAAREIIEDPEAAH